MCSPFLAECVSFGILLVSTLFAPCIGSDCKRGSASRSAELHRNLKYEGLCDRNIFQAIAIESSGVFGRDTNAFISRLDHLTTSFGGERRDAEFLRQRLSLTTVRGNAKSVAQSGGPSS